MDNFDSLYLDGVDVAVSDAVKWNRVHMLLSLLEVQSENVAHRHHLNFNPESVSDAETARNMTRKELNRLINESFGMGNE